MYVRQDAVPLREAEVFLSAVASLMAAIMPVDMDAEVASWLGQMATAGQRKQILLATLARQKNCYASQASQV